MNELITELMEGYSTIGDHKRDIQSLQDRIREITDAMLTACIRKEAYDLLQINWSRIKQIQRHENRKG